MTVLVCAGYYGQPPMPGAQRPRYFTASEGPMLSEPTSDPAGGSAAMFEHHDLGRRGCAPILVGGAR